MVYIVCIQNIFYIIIIYTYILQNYLEKTLDKHFINRSHHVKQIEIDMEIQPLCSLFHIKNTDEQKTRKQIRDFGGLGIRLQAKKGNMREEKG